MAAHGGGNEGEAQVTFRVGKGDRTAETDMAERLLPHTVRGHRIGSVFQHAAQTVAHRPAQRPVDATALLLVKVAQQFGADEASTQQSAVETRKAMGSSMAAGTRLVVGPPAGVAGILRRHAWIGER